MTVRRVKRQTGTENSDSKLIALITSLVVLAAYGLLRYGGRWGETDAATFTLAIQGVLEAGRLVPSAGEVYPNGYGYQVASLFVTWLGGLTVAQFQIYISLFLMPWLVLPAWILYRELTGSARGATLATAILLVQPEVLFPLLRGTHEKFTRGLILIALYLFVKSIGGRARMGRQLSFIVAFYLTIYAVIAFNNFLGFSLIAALLVSLGLLGIVVRLHRRASAGGGQQERRLLYAVLTTSVIAFLFTFYLYTPARHDILVLGSAVERLAAMLLNVERVAAESPYAYTAGAWISTPVYLLMSLANWLLLLVSAGIWLWQTWLLLRGRARDWRGARPLLWALYGAYALQGGLSIVADLSGAIGTNLQVRVFPAFAMMAAPLVAQEIVGWQDSPRRLGIGAWRATLAGLAILAVLSVLKATNEPLVSNKWAFNIPAEMAALDTARSVLPERSIWVGFDERLPSARILRDPEGSQGQYLDAWDKEGASRDVLLSDVMRLRGERISAAAPVEGDSLLTYDNGQAQLYHLRPRTPFQR